MISGTITQLRTSVSTLADLAGLPDDAYSAGELAFVSSLGLGSTYQLIRGTPPGPIDGIILVSTLSGNGYWKFFSQGLGGELVFANTGEMVAFADAMLPVDSRVFVESLRSYYILRPAAAPDGLMVMTASSGRSWFRQAVPELWSDDVDFYIGGGAGDDENDGLTDLTPIATLDELTRRTYNPTTKRSYFAVHVVGGTSGTFTHNADCEWFGVIEEITPLTEITNVVPFSRSAPYTAQEVTAAISWTPGRLLRYSDDNGVTYDYFGWMTRSGGAGVGVTKTWDTGGTTFSNPTVAYKVAEYSLPLITGTFISIDSSYLGFYTCSLNVVCRNPYAYLETCFLSPNSQVGFVNGRGISCWTSYINGATFASCHTDGAEATNPNDLTACVIVAAVNVFNSDITLKTDTSIVGASARVSLNRFSRGYVRGNVEAYGATIPFLINTAHCSFLFQNTGPEAGTVLYGAQNNNVWNIQTSGSFIQYSSIAALTVTSTVVDWSHSSAGGVPTSGAFGALPSAASIATGMVGIFEP